MKVYSYRLDKDLYQQFQQLAIQTYRSRSGLIRYLISLAIRHPHLVSPEIDISSIDIETIAKESANDKGEEGEL